MHSRDSATLAAALGSRVYSCPPHRAHTAVVFQAVRCCCCLCRGAAAADVKPHVITPCDKGLPRLDVPLVPLLTLVYSANALLEGSPAAQSLRPAALPELGAIKTVNTCTLCDCA